METKKRILSCLLPLICMIGNYAHCLYVFTHLQGEPVPDWVFSLFYDTGGPIIFRNVFQAGVVLFLLNRPACTEIKKSLPVYVFLLILSLLPLILRLMMIFWGIVLNESVYYISLINFSTAKNFLFWAPVFLYKIVVDLKAADAIKRIEQGE